jgi:hypothetical protein
MKKKYGLFQFEEYSHTFLFVRSVIYKYLEYLSDILTHYFQYTNFFPPRGSAVLKGPWPPHI